jgi:hypothetical protein
MVAPIVWAIAAAVIAVAISAIFLRPKQKKPDSVSQLDNPVAEAGKPIPVVFGTVTVKELNVLWYGDKWRDKYKKKSSKK